MRILLILKYRYQNKFPLIMKKWGKVCQEKNWRTKLLKRYRELETAVEKYKRRSEKLRKRYKSDIEKKQILNCHLQELFHMFCEIREKEIRTILLSGETLFTQLWRNLKHAIVRKKNVYWIHIRTNSWMSWKEKNDIQVLWKESFNKTPKKSRSTKLCMLL